MKCCRSTVAGRSAFVVTEFHTLNGNPDKDEDLLCPTKKAQMKETTINWERPTESHNKVEHVLLFHRLLLQCDDD